MTQVYECVAGIANGNDLVQLDALWQGQGVMNSFESWGQSSFPSTVSIVATLDTQAVCTVSSATNTKTRSTSRGPTDGRVNFVVAGATATFDDLFVVDRQ